MQDRPWLAFALCLGLGALAASWPADAQERRSHEREPAWAKALLSELRQAREQAPGRYTLRSHTSGATVVFDTTTGVVYELSARKEVSVLDPVGGKVIKRLAQQEDHSVGGTVGPR